MSGYSDGFRRGTNYNERMRRAGEPTLATLLAAAASQHARCDRGEHDETVAERNHVTWLGMGVRVEPGTRYCRYCKTILPTKE